MEARDQDWDMSFVLSFPEMGERGYLISKKKKKKWEETADRHAYRLSKKREYNII